MTPTPAMLAQLASDDKAIREVGATRRRSATPVFVFVRQGGAWSQEAMLHLPYPELSDGLDSGCRCMKRLDERL